MNTIVALIPARAGSKRIPGKNIRPLAGHPLLAYTIAAAKQSGIFDGVWVSSDSTAILDMGCHYGAGWISRPSRLATDESPDIQWVQHALVDCKLGEGMDYFSILRPTSPFRTAATIQRAWAQFKDSDADSLRAVEQWDGPHPGKMWAYSKSQVRIYPLMRDWARAPYHSSPTQSLIVPIVRQNASLEMARISVLRADPPTISGDDVMPFFTHGYEGFDLNTEEDWTLAEQKIASGEWRLPDL